MLTNTPPKVIDILLVEDSPSDALMTKEALDHNKLLNHLNIVDDGAEAMAYLRKQGKYAAAHRPDLILLDLNLPRKSGLEVLQEVKSDAALRTIPIVVLTTSKAEEDVVKSYENHANCFITKPVEFAKLTEAVKSIAEFWVCIVTLPKESR